MNDGRFTYGELLELIRQLDEELDKLGYNNTAQLNPIGGFAMLAHGLRQGDPTTGDIDCVSHDFDAMTQQALQAVCKRNDITDHWLNNDTVLAFDSDNGQVTQKDIDVANSVMEASYTPLPLNLKHIQVNVADIDTLARGKAIAVCDPGATRSGKDLDDLLDIFENEGIESYAQAQRRFSFLHEFEFDMLPEIYATAKSCADKAQRDLQLIQIKQDKIDYDMETIDSFVDNLEYNQSYDSLASTIDDAFAAMIPDVNLDPENAKLYQFSDDFAPNFDLEFHNSDYEYY